MEPIHKFNNGTAATLCKSCRTIITERFTDQLLCANCQEKALTLLSIIRQDAYEALDHTWNKSDQGFKSQIRLINNFINLDNEKF